MTSSYDTPTREFAEFVDDAGPRLRRALVAGFGSDVGRSAAVDALSWAWEHWERVAPMDNPVGYLYRVGQSAARRRLRTTVRDRSIVGRETSTQPIEPDVDLTAAIDRLSTQQRTAVVLVHGFAMPLRDVAEVMEISVASVREHVKRALARLRESMEALDVH